VIDVNYNEYKETIAENMKLIIENHDLKEKINKAIEYINTMPLTKGTEWYRIQLLEILRGEDNANWRF